MFDASRALRRGSGPTSAGLRKLAFKTSVSAGFFAAPEPTGFFAAELTDVAFFFFSFARAAHTVARGWCNDGSQYQGGACA